MKIAFIVESFSEPWNEGYKNIARYIYDLLKNSEIEISVIPSNEVKSTCLSKFEVIHVFNYKASLRLLIKYYKKTKFVKHFAKNDLGRLRDRIKFKLQSLLFWDAFTTTTPKLKQDLCFLGGNKIFCLPPPIPVDYFIPMDRNKCIQSLNLELIQSKKIIVYTGRLNKQRKTDWIYDCFSQKIAGVSFVLAISEGLEDNPLTRIDDLIILPTVKDVRSLYSIADLLIYPVERGGAVEPPLTVIEAMSCGCVVAAYKHEIIAEIISSGNNGFLFSNITELKDIVQTISKSNVNMQHLKQNARVTILTKFGNLLPIYRSFYNRLLINSTKR